VTTDVTLDRVVIIGGMPRSGTNLARRLIGSHSMIAMPPVEFNFLNRAASGVGVEQILRDPKLAQRYEPELEDLTGLDACAAYRALLARYAAHVGKPIAGEKSPRNEFHWRTIRQYLPGSDCRFVQMVRNPFDVIASYKNAPFRGSNPNNDVETIASVAEEWTRSASLGAARNFSEPDTYKLVRFEDLTTDTAAVMSKVCEFLDVEFEESRMLELSDYEGHGDNTSFKDPNRSSRSGPKIKQLESRKQFLSDADVETVAGICGEVALALGYDDPDYESRPAARLAARRSYLARLGRKLKLQAG